MANLGDLVIRIGGNVDGFKASMEDASSSAERFTSGIASQLSQSGTLFDQYGRTISSTSKPLEALTSQHTQLTTEVVNVGKAAEGMGFNFRYAFFGVKDIMEGRLKFAIAEAANVLIGMGTTALAVGAGIAAIGVGIYELGKYAGAWGGVSAAEKKATEEAEKLDKQILEINKHIAQTAQEIYKLQFGPLAAEGKELADSASKTAKDKALEASYQTLIREEKERLNALLQAAAQGAGVTEVLPFDDTVKSQTLTELQHKLKEIQTQIFDDEQESRLKSKQLIQSELDDTQTKANKLTELAKEAEAAAKEATQKLKAADEDGLAELKASHQVSVGEVIRFWKERLAAESDNVGRVHDIGITLGNLYQENDRVFERIADHGRKIAAEQIKKAEEQNSKLEILILDAEQLAEKIGTDIGEKNKKLTDIGAKATASGEEGAASFKKLEAERAFGLLLNQNGRARILLETQIEAADRAIADAKIEALRKEQEAETDAVKKAELGLELQKAIIAGAERQYQVETKIAGLKQKDSVSFRVREDIVHAGKEVPGALGNSLARGVFDGKHIGQDIANSLRGIGQQLLGGIFNRLITTLLSNIASHIGLTAATSANAAATGAHGGIMLTHAGVMLTHMGAVVLNTIATVANTLWTAILSAVETVKAFFGFADGGNPPVGVPSIVGERGPELFIPREAGTVIPNHMLNFRGSAAASSLSSSSSTTNSGGNTFHFHGVQDVRGMMRAIASTAKTASPAFSPFAR